MKAESVFKVFGFMAAAAALAYVFIKLGKFMADKGINGLPLVVDNKQPGTTPPATTGTGAAANNSIATGNTMTLNTATTSGSSGGFPVTAKTGSTSGYTELQEKKSGEITLIGLSGGGKAVPIGM